MSLLREFEARCSSGSDIHAHLPRLWALASTPFVKVIELGVRSGESTAAFLAAAEEHRGEVWSVDISVPPVPENWYRLPFWYLTVGDDLEVSDRLPDNVDVLFIDTSHTYEQTKAELELYWVKVKPGGVIVLHDTELERPEASPASDPDFPVMVAVREFAQAHGFPVEWVTGCYGLGIVSVV